MKANGKEKWKTRNDLLAQITAIFVPYIPPLKERVLRHKDKKMGFQEEGRLKNRIKVHDRYIDDIVMALDIKDNCKERN